GEGDTAELKAEFQAYCFGDGPATLNLPLDGVQLSGETLLDGARAYPASVKSPLLGYTLTIDKNSSPLHRISMRFSAPIQGSGSEREFSTTLPSVLHSHLKLELPRGTRTAEALSNGAPVPGQQRFVTAPAGPRIEADLGRLGAPLRLRWS